MLDSMALPALSIVMISPLACGAEMVVTTHWAVSSEETPSSNSMHTYGRVRLNFIVLF